MMNHEFERLLGCLKKDEETDRYRQIEGYSEKDWETVGTKAAQFGVAPLVYFTLKPLIPRLGIPGPVQEEMKAAYFRSAARNLRLYHQLLKSIEVFHRQGIEVILLKGAHLAETVYGNPALRPMGDVDLLARREDLGRIHDLLTGQGYQTYDRDRGCALEHLAPYRKPGAVSIEVHFHITSPPFSDRFDIGDLWQRPRPESFQGVTALTLGPEDLLLHLCLHASIHHGLANGLTPFLDILHTADRPGAVPDWEVVWKRSEEWGMRRSLILMLALTERMLGLSPPSVVRQAVLADREIQAAIDRAEGLVFDRSGGTPSFIARLFGPAGWRQKVSTIRQRVFPLGGNMGVQLPQRGVWCRFKLCRLYLLRVINLWKKHGKTVWQGLCKDPATIRALAQENQRNQLKDWLSQTDS